MSRRRSEFTVDAESAQGNPGAEVTFRALKVGQVREYRETTMTDLALLKAHVLGWAGMVDDDEKPLPSPADQPDILDELYLHEVVEFVKLLFKGPDETTAKN